MIERIQVSDKQSSAPSSGFVEQTLKLLFGLSKLVLFLLIIFLLIDSWDYLRNVIPRVTSIKALGVEVQVSDLKDALEQQAQVAEAAPVEIPPGYLEAALKRAVRVKAVFEGATILWVDDNPTNNLYFRQLLRSLGAGVEPARDNEEASRLVRMTPFDLIISDIGRDNSKENGIKGIERLQESGVEAPVVFHVANVDKSRPPPAGALGITNRPDKLLHFVIDGLERSRWGRVDPPE